MTEINGKKDAEAHDLILRCGDAVAVVRPFGAELRVWRVADADLLWEPDPSVWPAVSPILFPIVGRLRNDRLRVGDHVAQMGVHGFASRSDFAIASLDDDRVRLVLRDDEDSRAVYPFRFRLAVDYRLTETSVSTTIEVVNAGPADMPYACGLHPGFRWPFDGADSQGYRIEFERPESPEVPEISPEGLFGSTMRTVPMNGRILPLSPALLAHEALCFLDVASHVFRFVAPSGRAIRVEMSNFPHVALWSRPPAPYLCLETWTGRGDPSDFSGDLFDKPSMRRLAPGDRVEHAAHYRFESA